jgi:hypothetical protein
MLAGKRGVVAMRNWTCSKMVNLRCRVQHSSGGKVHRKCSASVVVARQRMMVVYAVKLGGFITAESLTRTW